MRRSLVGGLVGVGDLRGNGVAQVGQEHLGGLRLADVGQLYRLVRRCPARPRPPRGSGADRPRTAPLGASRPSPPRRPLPPKPRTRPARPPPPRAPRAAPTSKASASGTSNTSAAGNSDPRDLNGPDLGDLRLRNPERDRLGRLGLERLDSPDLGGLRLRTWTGRRRDSARGISTAPTSEASASGTSTTSAAGDIDPRHLNGPDLEDLRLRHVDRLGRGNSASSISTAPTSKASASGASNTSAAGNSARGISTAPTSETSASEPPNATGSAASAWSASTAPTSETSASGTPTASAAGNSARGISTAPTSETSASNPRTGPARPPPPRAPRQPPPRRPPPPARRTRRRRATQPEGSQRPRPRRPPPPNPRTRPARPPPPGAPRTRRPGPACASGSSDFDRLVPARLDRRALHLAQAHAAVSGACSTPASLGGANSTTLSGVTAAAASGSSRAGSSSSSPARPVQLDSLSRLAECSHLLGERACELELADHALRDERLAESLTRLALSHQRLVELALRGRTRARRRSPRDGASSPCLPVPADPPSFAHCSATTLASSLRETPNRSTRTWPSCCPVSRWISERDADLALGNEPALDEERADEACRDSWRGCHAPFYRQSLERAIEVTWSRPRPSPAWTIPCS